MSLQDLKVGDRVQVFDANGSREGQPPGGWDGTVVKVGRRLITVTYGHGYTTAFRLDDQGRSNDSYGHQHIETVEQAAENARRSEVEAKLRVLGIDLRRQVRIPTDKLEALVTILEDEA